jgi:hypothetical protein
MQWVIGASLTKSIENLLSCLFKNIEKKKADEKAVISYKK